MSIPSQPHVNVATHDPEFEQAILKAHILLQTFFPVESKMKMSVDMDISLFKGSISFGFHTKAIAPTLNPIRFDYH